MDENEFIEASCLVCSGMEDTRKVVLLSGTPKEMYDSDLETEDFLSEVGQVPRQELISL